jgi:hypothetical protein
VGFEAEVTVWSAPEMETCSGVGRATLLFPPIERVRPTATTTRMATTATAAFKRCPCSGSGSSGIGYLHSLSASRH